VITAANIIGSAKTEATRRAKTEQFGIAVTARNREVTEAADVLVLAVKPQFFPEVIAEIRDAVSENTLVISIAAGLTLERIAGLFDRNVTAMRLIRCMPNTPALVNAAHCRRTGAGQRKPTKHLLWLMELRRPSSFPNG
ncbi:MAG: pyrroline-5-carboxylate reductase family protein, partial [Adlercreutzia equolifaciens]